MHYSMILHLCTMRIDSRSAMVIIAGYLLDLTGMMQHHLYTRSLPGFVLFAFLFLPLHLFAQAERHELGRKLRNFEEAWETSKDPASREAAAQKMNTAVISFFSFKLPEAARAMDAGYLLLQGSTASPKLAELLSLWIKPEQRWLDSKAKTIKVQVDRFYPMPDGALREVDFAYSWIATNSSTINPQTLPGKVSVPGTFTINLPDKAGDYQLQILWKWDEAKLTQNYCTISLSNDWDARFSKVQSMVSSWPASTTSVEAWSAVNLVKLLEKLQKKETLETDYPADRLLTECEALGDAVTSKSNYYSQQRTGQYWLNLKSASKGNVILRVQPVKVDAGKKVPLVLALHGAGGSENLFFDGYGNGKVAKLAKERGWFVAAPRITITKPGHGDTIDELARIYPEIDTNKVFVVGHSMGAGEAMREACAHPGRFAAIAALGGGGGTKAAKGQEEAFKKLPIFVGVGELDFALKQAEALASNLKKTGVTNVTYKKYPVLEHMIIVQDALPEVFQFFDSVQVQK